MLDHVFISVSDISRSIAFYEKALAPLGIVHAVDYDGRQGPAGHTDLKGFGANGGLEVDAAYAAAMAGGAAEIHPPGPQLHYDPRYYAAQVTDPDGYGLEFVYSWQHETTTGIAHIKPLV